MTKEIWFDMDGTIADLYGVDGWLDDLIAENTRPYAVAIPLVNFSLLARLLNQLQAQGWKLGIVSWTSKNGSELYNLAIETVKRTWLTQHLPSVEWDEIKVVRYGTNKRMICGGGILFDDEEGNRKAWGAGAYHPSEMMELLKALRQKG